MPGWLIHWLISATHCSLIIDIFIACHFATYFFATLVFHDIFDAEQLS
jgi:hypothetical protein